MEKIFVVLFIGFICLGNSFSQEDEDEDLSGEYDPDDEEGSAESLTECERMSAEYRENKIGYNPTCLDDGQFASRQCPPEYCFCVDEQGKEISNTRGFTNCDGYDGDITFENPTREAKPKESGSPMLNHPGVLAGVIGGVVVCLLCAVLIVMFIVYRMKKKDEGSYILGRAERKNSRSVIYTKAVPRDLEFYA